MNIDQAKEEVKNAVRAYLEKDDAGQYEIPVERQRPILLMGPPGIGKTAVMEQIAHELGINLVAYTITHHTRQSAIGLPMISEKEFGGEKYSVTEYTMSEIIGAVYEQIEKSGIKEGILFLDEINCVSETLAPTMLQFLQYKTFGSHKLPEGFIIVTAGNPPQYNKSVRDFDIVTLDRVRQIYIEEDFEEEVASDQPEDHVSSDTVESQGLSPYRDGVHKEKLAAEEEHTGVHDRADKCRAYRCDPLVDVPEKSVYDA